MRAGLEFEDGYLPLKALATYSGLSVRTLRGYLKHPSRQLPHYRVYGHLAEREPRGRGSARCPLGGCRVEREDRGVGGPFRRGIAGAPRLNGTHRARTSVRSPRKRKKGCRNPAPSLSPRHAKPRLATGRAAIWVARVWWQGPTTGASAFRVAHEADKSRRPARSVDSWAATDRGRGDDPTTNARGS